ncbi:hypothetical protein [Rhodopseudomonas palustris]
MPTDPHRSAPGTQVLREAPPMPCARCGGRMCVTRIAPMACGRDLRSFECSKCGYVAQYTVKYGSALPWVLVGRQRH